jgi:ceroid-lipofuscinosis MFS transporter 7
MSIVEVGALVTTCGSVGFVQLLFFKYLYTSRYTDLQLMLAGIAIMIVAQILITYNASTPNFPIFILCFIFMYAFGYPIGHTAVLGAFSKLQKKGTQGALMGYFASAGSLARIFFPIISGYLHRNESNSPFCVVLFILSLSYGCIILIHPMYEVIVENKTELLENGKIPKSWKYLTRFEKWQLVVVAITLCYSIYEYTRLIV